MLSVVIILSNETDIQQNVKFVTNHKYCIMSIQEAVDDILKSRPYLEESLADGLINISSLARHLLKDVEAKTLRTVNKGAIVMAIQRHQPGKLNSVMIKTGNLLQGLSNIIVRSNISVYTFENSHTLSNRLAALSSNFSKRKGLFYTFSQGVFETTIILNQDANSEIQTVMQSEREISSTKNLACITLYLPDENTEIAGYYYFILKVIAWEGINITEILSTTNEFSIILDEADVDRAFSTLKNIMRK